MKRGSEGFTLLEILVAVVVLGTVLLLLSEGFRLGLNGRERYDRLVHAQAAMEPIARTLRGIIERMSPGHYPETPQVRGTDHALAFTSELPDPVSGGRIAADLRLEVDDGSLVLLWTPHARGIPFEAPPPPQRHVLLAGISQLGISYAAKAAPDHWLSTWTQPALPALVRILVVPSEQTLAWPPIVAQPRREQAEE